MLPKDRISRFDLLCEKAFVGGRWIEAASQQRFEVRDPATDTVIATVPDMDKRDANVAIGAAESALPAWRALTGKQRAAFLRKWSDLIVTHQSELAEIMTAEQGKPLAEAMGEVLFGASYVEWYGEEAKRTYGMVIPTYSGDRRTIIVKQPIGVVAAITPWNFPSAMVARKCAPAIAAGCTVVLKPAEHTPLSALALAALAERAGLPAGVLNVVTTSRPAQVGEAFTESPIVRKLSFTGSTPVGKRLMAAGAENVKKVTLELGGHAPFIVFDDADLDAAVAGVMASKFRTSGQTCVCANRVFVHRAVKDEFTDKLVSKVSAMRVANGFEEGSEQGPLITCAAVEKVERHINEAVTSGAKVLAGGARHEAGPLFFQPTVLSDVQPGMLITREETFGPVIPLISFETEGEVIEMANDSEYGLAAYVFTRDVGRAFRMGEALEAGSVGINTGSMSSETVPAGGVKQSGMGREGSSFGIEDYLEIKNLCVAGLDT